MDEPRFHVNADPQSQGIDVRTHVAGSRRDEEEAALNRLSEILPPPTLQELAPYLSEASNATILTVPGNEEATRLVSRIYAIRTADHLARSRDALRTAARRNPAKVTVALVEGLDDPSSLAEVRRLPGWEGRSLVVIPRGASEPARLTAAFAVLSDSRETIGLLVRDPVSIAVRSAPPLPLTEPAPRVVRDLVSRLGSAPRRTIPGIGRVPALDVELHVFRATDRAQ